MKCIFMVLCMKEKCFEISSSINEQWKLELSKTVESSLPPPREKKKNEKKRRERRRREEKKVKRRKKKKEQEKKVARPSSDAYSPAEVEYQDPPWRSNRMLKIGHKSRVIVRSAVVEVDEEKEVIRFALENIWIVSDKMDCKIFLL